MNTNEKTVCIRFWTCCFIAGLFLMLFLSDCAVKSPESPGAPDTVETLPQVPGLSALEVASLASLEQVDGFPFYVMYSSVDYRASGPLTYQIHPQTNLQRSWACSLYAALGDESNLLLGRNFDWEHSPALLLFANPPDAYASVSMVDLAYLIPEEKYQVMADLPVHQRQELLAAPYWPFDGMNEYGLAVGMAAVPDSPAPVQPGAEWIGSLGVIREILDNCRNIDEAVKLVKDYNISFEGGPQIHYLVADADGRAVVIELFQDEYRLHYNAKSWLTATNFTLAAYTEFLNGHCWRYDTLVQELENMNGSLSKEKALDLLSKVAQPNTQWSIVYGLSEQTIDIALGGNYNHPFAFSMSE